MAGRSVNPEKIIEMLAELKEKTPEYPPEMLDARKTAFMNQVVSFNLHGKGPGGESGGGSGGGGSGANSGTGFFGGLSATQGILLQATVGVWIIAAMLTAAYVFRNQIIDLLQGKGEVTQVAPIETAPPEFVSPVTEPPPTELPPTEPPTTSVEIENEDPSEGLSEQLLEVPTETTDGTVILDEKGKGNAFGVTPGAPDVPNEQGNPQATGKDQQPDNGNSGNPNPPDKPDKPDKNK